MRRILTLTVFLFCGVAIAMPASGQVIYGSTYISPSSPLFPKSHDECRALDAKWQEIRDALSRQHQGCLDAAAKRGKPCPDDTATGCSCVECAPFHGQGNLGREAVAQCTTRVNEYLAKVAQEKREADEKKQKDAERRRAAEEARNQRTAVTRRAGSASKPAATSTPERSASGTSQQKPARTERAPTTQPKGSSTTEPPPIAVHPEFAGTAAPPEPAPNNRGAETAAELINPFGQQPGARAAPASGDLVNPFAAGANEPDADPTAGFSFPDGTTYRDRAQFVALKRLQDIRQAAQRLNASGIVEVDLRLLDGRTFASTDFVARYRIGDTPWGLGGPGSGGAVSDETVKRELRMINAFSHTLDQLQLFAERQVQHRENMADARRTIIQIMTAAKVVQLAGGGSLATAAAEEIHQMTVRSTEQGKIRIGLSDLLRGIARQ